MKLSTGQILFVGLALFIVASFTSAGYHHSDEHWQLLEFANFKLGRSPQSNLASEYAKEMRSAFQPTVTFLLIKGFEGVGIKNPFQQALLLRLISCFLGWLVLSSLVLKSKWFGILDANKKILACISMLLWFIPYTSCRFSNENWAGFLFCAGILVVLTNKNERKINFLMAGILIGLAYLCRFQIAFAIIGIFVWLIVIKKARVFNISLFLGGMLLMVGLGFWLDKWFYGHYTFTAYNYFYANIVEGVAASFGVSPWWYYLKMIAESAAAPLSILLLIGYFYSFYFHKTDVVHFVVFFFLIGHSLVGHKELRFLFPMIYLLPVIITLGYQLLEDKWAAVFYSKWSKIFIVLVLVENTILLASVVFFKPAEETIPFNQFVYDLVAQKPVTIFYANDDPYKFGYQRQYFYFPKGLVLKKIENQSSLAAYKKQNPTRLILIFDPHFYPTDEIKMYIGLPVYKTFPMWATQFNIGNWLGRAKSWSLYSVK